MRKAIYSYKRSMHKAKRFDGMYTTLCARLRKSNCTIWNILFSVFSRSGAHAPPVLSRYSISISILGSSLDIYVFKQSTACEIFFYLSRVLIEMSIGAVFSRL